MIGAYFGGRLDDRLGSKRTLQISVGTASVVLLTLVSVQPDTVLYLIEVGDEPVWSSPYFATLPEIFYFCTNQVFALFFVAGLSASRTLMAKISPPEMATQFFGLFAACQIGNGFEDVGSLMAIRIKFVGLIINTGVAIALEDIQVDHGFFRYRAALAIW